MKYSITHQGKVTSAVGTTVSVVISDSSGCAGCALTASCGARSAPSSGHTLVEAYAENLPAIGSEVTVGMPSGVTFTAILRLLGAPLLLMLIFAVVAAFAGVGEGAMALSGLGAVAAWYAGLYVWSRFRPSPPLWRVIS